MFLLYKFNKTLLLIIQYCYTQSTNQILNQFQTTIAADLDVTYYIFDVMYNVKTGNVYVKQNATFIKYSLVEVLFCSYLILQSYKFADITKLRESMI